MSQSTQPTRQLLGGFCFRIVSNSGEATSFYATMDLVSKALAEEIDPEWIYSSRKSFVKARPNPELFLCDAGTCMTKVLKSEDRVFIEATAWKGSHVVKAPCSSLTHYEATDPFGKLLSMGAILVRGSDLIAQDGRTRRRYYGRFAYCGYGPVPCIRKWRGGYGYMRRVATTSERRLNALVVCEDGEVAARPARTGGNLPNSWDDQMRQHQNCWKSQHHGEKSWDRVRALSKAEKAFLSQEVSK